MRLVALSVMIMLLVPVVAGAQVEVIRTGEENPMITIAKATFWGGVTGLVLGGAVALVVDKDQEDYIKWFFVGGVFGGFAFGVYHVLSREKPTSSLLEVDENGLALGWPSIEVRPVESAFDGPKHMQGRVTLVSYGF